MDFLFNTIIPESTANKIILRPIGKVILNIKVINYNRLGLMEYPLAMKLDITNL